MDREFIIKISDEPVKERKRVCCNCGNNIRVKENGMVIRCECAIDGHYISYLQTFDYWCNRWRKDKKWNDS